MRLTINASVTQPTHLSVFEFPDFQTLFKAIEASGGVGEKEDSDLLVAVAEWKTLHRNVANITRMSQVFIGDVDAKTDQEMDLIVTALDGTAFGVYTTHSHRTPKKQNLNCYRVLIELDREYDPKEHPLLWAAVNDRLSGLLDPGAQTPEQGYYLPSTAAQGQHFAEAWFQEGSPWAVDELVGEAPAGGPRLKAGSPAQAPQTPPRSGVPGPSLQVLSAQLNAWARHQTDLDRRTVAKSAKALLNGRNEVPLGQGQRNTFLISLAGYLAHTWPDADPGSVADHFLTDGWDLFNDDGKYPLSSLVSMVERMQDAECTKREQMQEEKEEEQRRAILRATGGRRDHAITEGEVNHIQGVFGENWQEHLIAAYVRDLFFLRPDGTYDPNPVAENMMFVAARDRLAVFGDYVEYYFEDAQGAQRRKTKSRFLEEYAKVVRNVIFDMTKPEGGYHQGTETVFFPAARPTVAAVEHPEIQEWLITLDDHLPDMLAMMPHHDKMLPALVLTGGKNAGKTLLALGIGKIYGCAPIDGDVAFSNFNAALMTKQPIVFMDEKVSAAYTREGTTLLRKFLTCSSRFLDEKYKARVELRGFPRMVIAANNIEVLNTIEEMGVEDREAFSERLVHINMDPGRDALDKVRERIPTHWLIKDHLAEHLLHLSTSWKVRNVGQRFAVASNHTRLHDGLASQSGFAGDVAYWLLRFVAEKVQGLSDNGSDGLLVSFKDGILRANSRTIVEKWDRYLKGQRAPTPSQISKALKSLSNKSRQKLTYVVAGQKCWAHAYEIDPLQLRTANESHLLLENFDATFCLTDTDKYPTI